MINEKINISVRCHEGKFEGEEEVGFMFLVEVALGNMHFIKQRNLNLTEAPPGYDSIVARGKCEPGKFIVFKLKKLVYDIKLPIFYISGGKTPTMNLI